MKHDVLGLGVAIREIFCNKHYFRLFQKLFGAFFDRRALAAVVAEQALSSSVHHMVLSSLFKICIPLQLIERCFHIFEEVYRLIDGVYQLGSILFGIFSSFRLKKRPFLLQVFHCDFRY